MKGIACIFSEMSTSTVSESSREIGAFNQKLFQSVRESEDSKVLLEKLLTLRREVTQVCLCNWKITMLTNPMLAERCV